MSGTTLHSDRRQMLDHLRKALVEAVLPLEVIAAQDRAKPYRELSPELVESINEAIQIVREALAVSEEATLPIGESPMHGHDGIGLHHASTHHRPLDYEASSK